MSLRTIAAAATVATLAALAVAAPASGSRGFTDECTPNDHIEITGKRSNFMPADGNYFKAGPGGKMVVTSKNASTVTTTLTGTAGVTVDSVIASAQISVSVSVAKAVTVETGIQYEHEIAPGKYGNIQYGVYGWDIDWAKVRVYSNCTYTNLAVGSGKVPSRAYGWQYWESN